MSKGPGRALQAEGRSQSAIDFLEQAHRGAAGVLVEIRLVQRDQRRDIDTESRDSPLAVAGRKTLPGIVAKLVLDVMTAAITVANRLVL